MATIVDKVTVGYSCIIHIVHHRWQSVDVQQIHILVFHIVCTPWIVSSKQKYSFVSVQICWFDRCILCLIVFIFTKIYYLACLLKTFILHMNWPNSITNLFWCHDELSFDIMMYFPYFWCYDILLNFVTYILTSWRTFHIFGPHDVFFYLLFMYFSTL